MIDGCTPIQTFFKVVLPISKPTCITVMILQAMWIWNDYLLPSLVLDTKKLPEIVWDMAVERFTWEELMMKYHISHTMVAKYRKKAIKELDALYEERDRQTESFILR